MKEDTINRIFFFVLIVVGAVVLYTVLRPEVREVESIAPDERLSAYLLLLEDLPDRGGDYMEYLRVHAPEGNYAGPPISPEGGFAPTDLRKSVVEFTVNVPKAGIYVPTIRYRRTDTALGNTTLRLRVDGELPFNEADALELTRLWHDESKDFGRDRYNDETLPKQIPSTDWLESPFYDTAGRLVDPLGIYLDAGLHRLSLENPGATPVRIGAVRLEAPPTTPNYDQYRSQLGSAAAAPAEGASIQVDAIDYVAKNAYDVRLGSSQNPSVKPFHPVDRLLNVVDGLSWEQAGEEIRYRVMVPRDGSYTLTLRYNNPKADFSTFRSIRVDGVIPFDEFSAYEFPSTGANGWRNELLSNRDGEPYRVFLTKGEHVLSLKAEKEPISDAIRALKMITAHMNYFGIEIIKVAGREVDEYRTWRLTDYIGKTAAYLDAYHVLVSDIIGELAHYSDKGIDSAVTASLYTALFKLEKLAEKPDELPIYLKDIYSTSIYDRPITQIMGDTVSLLEDCEMGLDAIYVDAAPQDHGGSVGIFARGWAGLRSLVATFTSDKYVTRNSAEELNVWVTRPITHIDLMQKMADADFTARTGIRVKISVMPEPNRLILATAANRTPDVAMGLPSYIPFDLAVRGAALELSQFDDFWSFAAKFSPGAFIPYILNEKVYGMPETLDFHTLVYRTDIFKQLGLEPPDTWDDVIEELPVLQRYGMNFYHPVAGGLPTLKWFYQTSPFVYQFGGHLYDHNGLSVSLDDPKTVAALRFSSELFSLYALQEQVPVFYNSFRFGVIPVGIVDSQSYLQLKYAAPELKGQWALAPYPGIPDENGDPQRWFIANGVAAVIMKDTDRPEESWEFMKWWLSEETQVDFGYRLQSTYGPEFLWISANLDALASAPIEEREKSVILEQVKWQRDVPRTPAQYMLERGLSDIWINSATKNAPIRTEIDKMIPVIDREVKRKMTEFGYIDEEGHVLKPFIVPDIDWIRSRLAPYIEGEQP